MKVREIIKQIEEDGWYLVRTRGSHRQYKHPTKSGLVTIPGKPSDDLAPGTLNSILKQAQLKQQSENTEHQQETEEESN
ncbi:addiction module toxin, HicA family [[Phormidium ambiguum] IAM M-71]|uniref:Addiction module toxin, HicA family n=1 Tax=[Phormidium ambiguum] IAM M-71 TaxID=454136 RepID=A0A1U7ITU1_9CYAN|nr:type II toxin-antitoxin system HicA family toxin [Phormidium ambiguum]OKH40936.1 addiction module toxin, HicA family [Phormidium ambiguum IAM M-71]